MTGQLLLLWQKLDHLQRMRAYLTFSRDQTAPLMPIVDWTLLTPEHHQILAAFRVRFSDFQEHLGKAMRAIAIEEEQRTEPFTAILLYMEKLGIIDSAERWKEIRELRNAINHEYEDDTARLGSFFAALVQSVPELLAWHDRLDDFCRRHYAIPANNGPDSIQAAAWVRPITPRASRYQANTGPSTTA